VAAETLKSLRRYAIAHSLVADDSIQAAIDRLGFIQADPIRSPARAQDLILRHRVDGYRAGDLERQYASLDVEEDYLYAYGFVSRHVWSLLHPRQMTRLRNLERKVLDVVASMGEAHPASLAVHLGKRKIVNAWGGQSKATTNALEWLHWRGLLRVARRENGIRVYAPRPESSRPGWPGPLYQPAGPRRPAAPVQPSAPGQSGAPGWPAALFQPATLGEPVSPGLSIPEAIEPSARLRELTRVLVNIFAPVPEKTLHTLLAPFRHLAKARPTLSALVDSGEVRRATVAGVSYVWLWPDFQASHFDVPSRVRFLAPFDPVVWDRRRFEHLWGWSYRFEAYTPPAKRVRGYYAMPLLWRDEIPGWANARVANGQLHVEVGFVDKRPPGRDFTRALDAEIASLAASVSAVPNAPSIPSL
jgi:uncharacterized protein YcaQ